MRWKTLAFFSGLVLAGSAIAQPQSMLLELRIVPQSGALPGAITDGPISLVPITPADVTAEERTRRFELQFRLLDLTPADDYWPSGLSAASINITAEVVGVPANDLTIDRARLSRSEAVSGGSVPPTATDSSGFPLGPMSTARGLHAPYRGGFGAPAPNNDAQSNGTISGLSILNITPLALAASGQGDYTYDPANQNAWYGLYSFELIAGADFAGFITFTATAVPDANTGQRFGYFRSGYAVPATSTAAVDASITVVVINIPSPGSSALFLAVLCISPRRRSTAHGQ